MNVKLHKALVPTRYLRVLCKSEYKPISAIHKIVSQKNTMNLKYEAVTPSTPGKLK